MAARGDIDFTGIMGEYVTFDSALTHDSTVAGGHALVDKPVKVDNTGVVAATDGSAVLGKLVLVESDGACNVQVAGFMKFAYTGAAAGDLGKRIVGSATAGEVRAVNSAVAAEMAVARGTIVAFGTNYVWVLL